MKAKAATAKPKKPYTPVVKSPFSLEGYSSLSSVRETEQTVVIDNLAPSASSQGESEKQDSNNKKAYSVFEEAPIFKSLSSLEREVIWQMGNVKTFEKGTVIADYLTSPEGLFVIMEGKVCSYFVNQKTNEEKIARTLGPGASFGEPWVLIDAQLAERYRAEEQTSIYIIEKNRFLEILDNNGSIARKLYTRFAKYLVAHPLNAGDLSENLKAS